MLGMMYKDFLIMKKELLLNAVEILIAMVLLCLPWGQILENNSAVTETVNGMTMTFVIVPLMMYLMIFITLGGLQNNLFAGDERKCYSGFITATPMTAKGHVLSKYYETLLIAFVGVVIGMICDLIASVVSGIMGSASLIYLSLFFLQIFFRAIDMPFLIRYGQSHGKTVKVLMLVAGVFLGIVYLLFGPLPDMDSNNLIDWVLKWFLSEKNLSTAMLGVVALFPYIAFGAFYVSYRISVKLYQKGVETYDC